MRYRAAAVVLALAAAVAIGQVPMYSDYPWGLLDNGVDQGPVYNLNCKPPLWCSIPSYGDGVIQLGDGGVLPIWVAYANDAGWAERSLRANFSDDAGWADSSGTALFAFDAGFAFTSGSAGTSLFAFDAGAADFATAAGVAVYALDAGQANYAPTAGYAASAGTATTASTADVAAYALDAGKADYATSAGSAGTATTATYAADAGNLVCVGCIIADRLGLGAVIREKIQTGAIDHTRVADGGLLGNNITPGGIGTPQLASQAITNDKLGPFAVTEDKIDAGAITSVKIQDGAVVEGKIGALAVTAGKIGAGAVTEAKIDTGAVTETKIGALAVTNGKLGDLSISSGKLQDSAVIEAKLGTGAVTNAKIGALAVDSAKLAAAAVTTAKIATGAVTSNELGALAVTTAKIAAGAVTTTELGASAVTNAKLASLAVATGNIQAGAVTTNELGASAVTNAKLASLSVATGNIQSGAVTTNQIGALAVTTAKIANANVTTEKVADLGITDPKLNDGIPLSAYDEETVAGISSRATATNATKGAWDGSTGYIRLTLAVGSTNPQLSTGLATGTSTNLRTTNAVMRYRISGGASSNVLKMEAINTANVAQKSSTVFLADGSWHTAVFDISGWATAGTLRIDLTTNALGSTGYWDVAYIATGVVGSGTGALISYQGNVGVGTATPGSKLSVRGGIIENSSDGSTDARLALFQTDGANVPTSWLGLPSWNKTTLYLTGPTATGDEFAAWYGGATWQFLTGGTDRMRINSSGNVGIGTTSPQSTLHVKGTVAYGTVRLSPASDNGEASMGFYQDAAGTDTNDSWIVGQGGWGNTGKFTIGNENNGAGGNVRLVIEKAGKVGIGVTAPEEQLEVRTAASAYGLLHSDGTRKVGSYVDTTGGWYGTKSNHDLKLFTNNGASRLTITAGGEVRLPDYAGGGTTGASLDNNGRIIRTASDERLKENIVDFARPLDAVLRMRPVRFQWKDKEAFGDRWDIGFIAQEMISCVPEAVSRNPDGMYSLDYQKLVAVLAGAIQELYEDRTWLARRVQALEDKAEAAEKRLADLEARLARLEAK